MEHKQPYSLLHVLAVVLAPVWIPLMLVLFGAVYLLVVGFVLLCFIAGGILITAGSLLQAVRLEGAGLWLRKLGTGFVDFGGETFMEFF